MSRRIELVQQLKMDLKKAASSLSKDEARFLVDTYYLHQKNRIRSFLQVRDLRKADEPAQVLDDLVEVQRQIEDVVKLALDHYTRTGMLNQWARSQTGVGPVIAAGLCGHIDMEIATTPAKIWRFAGLDPTVTWEPRKKRPWNAALKTLCWKLGDSFVKSQSRKNPTYGRIYVERREYEERRNNDGELADQAEKALAKFASSAGRFRKYLESGKAPDAKSAPKGYWSWWHYQQGKLPPAHLLTRASRYAVKVFLAHYWEVGREELTGEAVESCYHHLRQD